MAKKSFAAIVILISCIMATPIHAEENKDVKYTQDASLSRGFQKEDIRVVDDYMSEMVDTIYTVYFDGGEFNYNPGENVLVKRGDFPTYVRIENLQEGDVLYVSDDVENTIVVKDVEEIYKTTKKTPFVKYKTTRSGWGMGVRLEGEYGLNQAMSQGFNGRASLVIGYDLKKFGVYASLGASTRRYGNLSQKNNMYISPFVGIEAVGNYYAFGDHEEHTLYAGLGFEASYRKQYFEDEFMWMYDSGWGLRGYAVLFGYKWHRVGAHSSIRLDLVAGYEVEKGQAMTQAHGGDVALRFSYFALFSTK
jgi:hypothetical protein